MYNYSPPLYQLSYRRRHSIQRAFEGHAGDLTAGMSLETSLFCYLPAKAS